MGVGEIVLIGAAGLGAYVLLSGAQPGAAAGGGGSGAPPPGDSGVGQSTNDPLGGLGEALRSFLSPSSPPASPLSPQAAAQAAPTAADGSKKAAASFPSQYTDSTGNTVYAANFSTLNGPAYVDPSGKINPANFSSLVTGGPAYVPVPSAPSRSSGGGSSSYASTLTVPQLQSAIIQNVATGGKKAAASTPSSGFYQFDVAPVQNSTPANANFSSATLGATYVPPPVSTSSNKSSSSSVGSSSSSSTTSTKKASTQTSSVKASDSAFWSSYKPKPAPAPAPKVKSKWP